MHLAVLTLVFGALARLAMRRFASPDPAADRERSDPESGYA